MIFIVLLDIVIVCIALIAGDLPSQANTVLWVVLFILTAPAWGLLLAGLIAWLCMTLDERARARRIAAARARHHFDA